MDWFLYDNCLRHERVNDGGLYRREINGQVTMWQGPSSWASSGGINTIDHAAYLTFI